MKNITAVLTIMLITGSLTAQKPGEAGNTRPAASVWTGLLGEGSLLSMNYEHIALSTPAFFLAAGAGLGYNTLFFAQCTVEPCESDQPDFITLPHHISACLGGGAHYLETGLGGTMVFGNTGRHYIVYPLAGYRLHPRYSNRVLLRLTFSYPPGKKTGDILYVPWGISVGMSF